MPSIPPSSKQNGNQGSPKSSLFSNPDKGEVKEFYADDPRWDLSEIILSPTIRETIEDVINFIQHRKHIIDDWELNRFLKGSSSVGINLYGAPGTGKSCTAEAIAKALGKKIVKVDYSEIQDSKLGQTEKNLTELFRQAEENEIVIFMDEADGLLGQRAESGSNAAVTNDIKSHLLTLVDRSNVVIIYATNLFKNFDKAFFRRILYHIRYDLPTEQELIDLWKFHMGSSRIPVSKDNFSFNEIAKASCGSLSGGDIRNLTLKLCVRLAAGRIKELTNEIVIQEIEKYKQSLADSRGIRPLKEEEMTDYDKKMLDDYNKKKEETK